MRARILKLAKAWRRDAPAPAQPADAAPPWSRREVIGGCTLYLGDCVRVMAALPAASVHAVVTDPPYELGFMGKAWDAAGGVASDRRTWAQALRLLTPGGHLAAFAGSRTYHRIASAIDDAGFEIRDQLMWLYGSGFPKSLDVAKDLDKQGGVWRGRSARALPDDALRAFGQHYERTDKGRPVSETAQAWDGWGTALKPAHEPIALGRKPIDGVVRDAVLAHGTGALNVEACRIGNEARVNGPMGSNETLCRNAYGVGRGGGEVSGRWPANVITDGSTELLELFPPSARDAIRFFYAPKADKADREFGLDGGEKRSRGRFGETVHQDRPSSNFHPTVKPVDLMRWLCRLLTPPGGTVLEPFMGSGSTGIAAVREGFGFVGIEQSPEYFEIALKRIRAAVAERAAVPDLLAPAPPAPVAEQLGLL